MKWDTDRQTDRGNVYTCCGTTLSVCVWISCTVLHYTETCTDINLF